MVVGNKVAITIDGGNIDNSMREMFCVACGSRLGLRYVYIQDSKTQFP